MSSEGLPRASARVSDAVAGEIVRLDLRAVAHAEIARRLKVHRQTVERVLTRTRATRRINHDLSDELAHSLAVYVEIQSEAWTAIEEAKQRGRSPAALLSEVRQVQTRIDGLLGLEPIRPDTPLAQLSRLKSTLVDVIHEEVPEAAPRVARRLLSLAAEEDANE